MLHARVPRTLWMTPLGMSRTRIPVYLTLGFVCIAARQACAASWGAPEIHAFMGQPLSVQIPVEASDADRMGPDCLKALVHAGTEDGPRMNGIKAWATPLADGSKSRWMAEIHSSTPVAEPVLHVTVSMGCRNAMVRQFAVLAEPPLEIPELGAAQSLADSERFSSGTPVDQGVHSRDVSVDRVGKGSAGARTRKGSPATVGSSARAARSPKPRVAAVPPVGGSSPAAAAPAPRSTATTPAVDEAQRPALTSTKTGAGSRLKLEPTETWTVDQPPLVQGQGGGMAVGPAGSLPAASGAQGREPQKAVESAGRSADSALQTLTRTNDALREANAMLMHRLEQTDQRISWLLLAMGLISGGLGAAGFLLWRRQQHMADLMKPWWEGATVDASNALDDDDLALDRPLKEIFAARLPEASGEDVRPFSGSAETGIQPDLSSTKPPVQTTPSVHVTDRAWTNTSAPASAQPVRLGVPLPDVHERETHAVHEVWYSAPTAASGVDSGSSAKANETCGSAWGDHGDQGDEDILTSAWDATLAFASTIEKATGKEGMQPEPWQGLSRDDGSDASAPVSLSAEALVDLERQVEFFTTIGQEDAAKQALQAALSPGQRISPLVYVKLMEICRQQGDRAGFDALAAAWLRHFGRGAPSWDEDGAFVQRRHPQDGSSERVTGLAAHPELLSELASVWSRPLDAMTRIEHWLFPEVLNPEATQTGWQLPWNDAPEVREGTVLLEPECYPELLMLYAVTRDLWQSSPGLEESTDHVDLLLPLIAVPESEAEKARLATPESALATQHVSSDEVRSPGTLEWEPVDLKTMTAPMEETVSRDPASVDPHTA